MMSPIADPSILAPYPKKSTWVPPIGREFGMSSPVRVLMANGKWKPGVPDSLKSRYAKPIDCPPPQKGPGPVMYIPQPVRARAQGKNTSPVVRMGNDLSRAIRQPSKVTREKVIALQAQGLTRTQIARELKCHPSRITQVMPRGKRFRKSDAHLPRVKELFAAGWNPGRIAREIGVDRVTVVRMLGRLNIR